MVPSLGLIVRLVMGCNNGAERFRGVQHGFYVGHDACETYVVLWSRLGRPGEVDVCSTTEPDARALVCAKVEWSCDDPWRLDCDGLEEGQDVIAIICDCGQRLGGGLFLLTCLRRLLLLCLYAAFAVLVVVVVFPAVGSPSFAHSMRERAKIFRSSPTSDFVWRIVDSVRNDGRRTALRGVKSRCFFKCTSSPAAARRRTSAIGRWILLPSVAKVMTILRETTED